VNSAAAADGEENFSTSDKRNESDFALWKAAKVGEPAWDSPECARDPGTGILDKGRPGGPAALLYSIALLFSGKAPDDLLWGLHPWTAVRCNEDDPGFFGMCWPLRLLDHLAGLLHRCTALAGLSYSGLDPCACRKRIPLPVAETHLENKH
jgi:hypothetical protein